MSIAPGGAVLKTDLQYKCKGTWYKFEVSEKRLLEPSYFSHCTQNECRQLRISNEKSTHDRWYNMMKKGNEYCQSRIRDFRERVRDANFFLHCAPAQTKTD